MSGALGTACLHAWFLVHAFENFNGQVVGVVLGDVGHDVVEQLARGTVIHRLCHRNELGASRRDDRVDVDVIAAVPGQPIDLGDDDVVDAQPLQFTQNPLQFRPIG